jgi:hypothetical protein
MNTPKQQQKPTPETKLQTKATRQRRFSVVKLEERIAPSTAASPWTTCPTQR